MSGGVCGFPWGLAKTPKVFQEGPAEPPDKTNKDVKFVRRRPRPPMGPRGGCKNVTGGLRRFSGHAAPMSPDEAASTFQEGPAESPDKADIDVTIVWRRLLP